MMAKWIAKKSLLGVPGAALAVCLTFAAASGQAQNYQNNFPQMPGLSENSQDTGYLGISMEEVTADKAKELKLPAVRGVFVADVEQDSPAAKAGVKKGDVITEYNGEQVEGTLQLARLVRETPPGHTAQLSVWRDGHAQKFSAELGHAQGPMEGALQGMNPRMFLANPPAPGPGNNNSRNNGGNNGNNFQQRAPRDGARETPALGISAQDLTAQLGSHFGVPSGEGVLVSDVHKGSAGEKAGLKAGDVITKVDGQAVRNVADLRTQLRAKRSASSIALTVMRDGKETNMNVQPDKPAGNSQRQEPL
jgi:serine protease Do